MSTLKALLRSASTSLTSCGLLVAGGCVSAGLGGGLLLALLAGTYLGWVDVSFPTGSSSVGVSNTAGEVRVEYENAEEGKPRLSSYEGILPGFVDLGTTQASVDLNDNTIDGTVITPDGEVFDLKDVLPGLRVEPSVEGDGFVATLSDGGTEYRYGLTVEATAANDGDALTGGVRIDRLVTQDGETILEDSGEGTIEAEQEQVDGGTKPTPLVLPPAPVMADAGPPRSIAKNDSVMLEGEVHGGSDVSVLWTPSDGLSDPTALQPIASPETTTTYTLTATNEDGSRAIHSATVTVGPEVPLSCAERDCNDGIFCNGEETCTPVRCVSGSEGDECGCLFVFGDNPCGPGRTCDEADRSCDGASCTDESCEDDGLYCNGTESCDEGENTCVHSGNPCPSGQTCNEAGKICEEGPCTGDGECDDGRFCNGPESCSAGECVPGVPPCESDGSCDEASSSCAPAQECTILDADITTDTTLPAGCYTVAASLRVRNNAILDIQGGAQLFFQSNHSLSVSSDGTLRAVGTAANPILMTGEQPIPGFWGGVLINNSPGRNQLEFVTIEFGGGGTNGNLVIDGNNANAEIRNCTFQDSDGYGIRINWDGTVPVFEDNTITRNTLGIARVSLGAAGLLTPNNNYTGNEVDLVVIDVKLLGTGERVTRAQTWHDLGGASYLIGHTFHVHAQLSLTPGTKLVFQSGTAMRVEASGSLHAIGTASAPIVLTGEQPHAGFWAGVLINNSPGPNQLEFVTIEFGGGVGFTWRGDRYANLVIEGNNANAEIRNCTFQDSAGYGIRIDSVATVNADVASANTFEGNDLGDIGS